MPLDNIEITDTEKHRKETGRFLEAFPVDDGRSRLIVFLLRDPHLLERRQRSQDRASDPYRVLSLWRCDDLDLHGGRSQGSDLLLHPVSDTRIHGGASRQHRVRVQILSNVVS